MSESKYMWKMRKARTRLVLRSGDVGALALSYDLKETANTEGKVVFNGTTLSFDKKCALLPIEKIIEYISAEIEQGLATGRISREVVARGEIIGWPR